MLRSIPKVALLIGALAVAGQASAHGRWGPGPALFGAVVGGAIIGSVISSHDQRPVYVQQPVYAQPPPVYVQAPPVYYQPQPVYVPPPNPFITRVTMAGHNRCITAHHAVTTARRAGNGRWSG